MRTPIAITAILLLSSTFLAAPAAAAGPSLPPLVGACVDGVGAGCYGAANACVWVSLQVPFCVDVPCYGPVDCISTPPTGYCVDGVGNGCGNGALLCVQYGTTYCIRNVGPVGGACVNGVTSDGCYRGDVCVWFSLQVPQCVDVPCYPDSCAITTPVSVCVGRVVGSCDAYQVACARVGAVEECIEAEPCTCPPPTFSASCREGVFLGAAYATCTVNGETYTIATCESCVAMFVAECHQGTRTTENYCRVNDDLLAIQG